MLAKHAWLDLRIATLAVATVMAVSLSAALLGDVFAANGDGPSFAQAENPKLKKAATVRTTPMSRCMATWDASTQMSKQDWRQTCKRTVRQYPGLYNKPF